jgi:hypothetical protein
VIACVNELQLSSVRGNKNHTMSGTATVSCVYVFVIQQQTAIQRQGHRMETFTQLFPTERGGEENRYPSCTVGNAPQRRMSCTIKPQNAQLTIQLLSLVRSPFLDHACTPHVLSSMATVGSRFSWAGVVPSTPHAHFIILFWVVRFFSPVFTTVPL